MSVAGKIKKKKIGASDIEVGRYTYGYEGMIVKEWGEGSSLKIGSFCSIAEGLTVMLGGNHRLDWATTFPFGHIFQKELGGTEIIGHPKSNGDVVIGNDVWIGFNTTIMSGVKIGNGAVIAANSTIVKDVGAYEVWGGNPAKMIKTRFPAEVVRSLEDLKWWDWDVKVIKQFAPLLSQVPNVDSINKIAQAAARMSEK